MINFNVPPFTGKELQYIQEAVANRKLCGDGPFTKRCNQWLEETTGAAKALLTSSCTHATEMAAMLCDVGPGDEVIMPSYTFVSTADAFVLRGATAVFVDIRPETMNMDERLVEQAITPRTKAIVPVHYAGVCCDMDVINALARAHNLMVVEDAAQAILCEYKGRPAGMLGDFGCYSFHETKNLSMGEGGALLIHDPKYVERAEIIREKGTNRSKFFRGEIDKYTWVDAGSSYLPSELNAAYLWAQMEIAGDMIADRMASWNYYNVALRDLANEGRVELPYIPAECKHNAHMFFIKAKDLEERTELLRFLKQNGVGAVFHYVPLHSSVAGQRLGRFCGEDRFTTRESERLVRLPLYYGMGNAVEQVAEAVRAFYRGK